MGLALTYELEEQKGTWARRRTLPVNRMQYWDHLFCDPNPPLRNKNQVLTGACLSVCLLRRDELKVPGDPYPPVFPVKAFEVEFIILLPQPLESWHHSLCPGCRAGPKG